MCSARIDPLVLLTLVLSAMMGRGRGGEGRRGGVGVEEVWVIKGTLASEINLGKKFHVCVAVDQMKIRYDQPYYCILFEVP